VQGALCTGAHQPAWAAAEVDTQLMVAVLSTPVYCPLSAQHDSGLCGAEQSELLISGQIGSQDVHQVMQDVRGGHCRPLRIHQQHCHTCSSALIEG